MSGQQHEPAVAGAETDDSPARDDATPPAHGDTASASARDGAGGSAEEEPSREPREPSRSPVAAADAFDLLYGGSAPALARQAFLLCGGSGPARRSVARAFRLAWRRWPQVAADADPAGRVRAAAHRCALTPWRGLWPVHLVRRVRAMRHVPPGDRVLLDALLRLPPSYRAALLLHDGLGLSLGDTAAEVEAGTAATSGRLRHAREALAERVPVLRDAPPGELPGVTAQLVRQLAAPQPVSLPPARRVRRSSEVRAWCGTAAALGLTVFVAATAFALVTSDGERNPPSLHVPKPPSATLGPERQPGRLQPLVGSGALTGPPEKTGGPAPRAWGEGAGPWVVRAQVLRA